MKRSLVAAVLATAVACSYFTPLYGTFPGNGETGVDPDVEIRIDVREFDRSMPSLAGAFRLSSFADVEFDIRIEGDEVVLIPLSPLEEGEYHLSGSLVGVRDGASGHWANGLGSSRGEPRVDTRFHVGGQATATLYSDEALDRWVIVFSEPVRAATLEGRVYLDGSPVALSLGAHPRVFVIPAEVQDLADLVPEVELSEGILTERGTEVTAGSVGTNTDYCSYGHALGDTRLCW